MQTLSLENVRIETGAKSKSLSLSGWFKKHEAYLEFNRFGITAALVLLQVSVAGFNVVIPALAGASIWFMVPGISMAFLSNSFAFAQMKMPFVLMGFAVSILINAIISGYFFIQLF